MVLVASDAETELASAEHIPETQKPLVSGIDLFQITLSVLRHEYSYQAQEIVSKSQGNLG